MYKKILVSIILVLIAFQLKANYILIPMDDKQSNHLKAYGISYWILGNDVSMDWLLNFRGGSFLVESRQSIINELIIRGVSYEIISDAQTNQLLDEIASPSSNKDAMRLDKVPKIAVYSPKSKQPWDDAVTLVLTYAEIPYDVIFDDEVMNDELADYDWLHLHHEDFTGQFGKFHRTYSNQPWYIEQQNEYKALAKKYGFKKVSEFKLAVVQQIQSFVTKGGFLFAMCSATDTYDISLAAAGIDIVGRVYDGDPADPNAQEKLDYDKTFAFKDFVLEMNPLEYEYSNIDQNIPDRPGIKEGNDFFTLFEFSAKWDPIPTMLTQNHEKLIKGFMGQTTAYKKDLIKSDVVILGETESINEARYIHGIFGKGFWTFYGGHDPEDYQHFVGEPPTDLNLHPNSAGYRLILNNILFPAAKKKKKKT
ncbi:asparagine synthetase B [Marivirga sp. S37H4]|uniref:Asparagine synthetase B n=1 Tax=Marivirga aurantiaca TaxID=2802615 RepID=A0A935C725_9BACT|nr:asparagine synthetase B [Marivirga aurantiaca]MBK6264684.1 asparagine synthetase B [Marivirga aurantiaca]